MAIGQADLFSAIEAPTAPPPSAVDFWDGIWASLLLHKYHEEEIRRLDEKARLMSSGQFDERSKQSDAFFKSKNEQMLARAEHLLKIEPAESA